MPDNFVSTDLHKIKDKLSQASKQLEKEPKPDKSEIIKPAQAKVEAPQDVPLNQRQVRYAEMMTSLTQALSITEEDLKKHEIHEATLRDSQSALSELMTKLKNYEDKLDLDEDEATDEYAETDRALDTIQLELTHIWARLYPEHTSLHQQGQRSRAKPDSLMPEILSLGVAQLMKIGFSLFFPVIAAIIFATILICMAIILTFTR